MKKILFVCTGNTCRSCMAEGIFNSLISQTNAPDKKFMAVSAGLAALDGDNASKNAIDALIQEWGIDISSHSSRGLRKKDVDEAWLILTMTHSHKKALLTMCPEVKGKVYTLKEYANTNKGHVEADSRAEDIPDPYGMPPEAYRSCARDIRAAVKAVVEKLVNEQ